MLSSRRAARAARRPGGPAFAADWRQHAPDGAAATAERRGASRAAADGS